MIKTKWERDLVLFITLLIVLAIGIRLGRSSVEKYNKEIIPETVKKEDKIGIDGVYLGMNIDNVRSILLTDIIKTKDGDVYQEYSEKHGTEKVEIIRNFEKDISVMLYKDAVIYISKYNIKEEVDTEGFEKKEEKEVHDYIKGYKDLFEKFITKKEKGYEIRYGIYENGTKNKYVIDTISLEELDKYVNKNTTQKDIIQMKNLDLKNLIDIKVIGKKENTISIKAESKTTKDIICVVGEVVLRDIETGERIKDKVYSNIYINNKIKGKHIFEKEDVEIDTNIMENNKIDLNKTKMSITPVYVMYSDGTQYIHNGI